MDAASVPLAVALRSGKHNDVTQLPPPVDGITPVAERGYDHDSYR